MTVNIAAVWGSTVLSVTGLASGAFVIGDGDGCDFAVSGDVLGAAAVPFVLARAYRTTLVVLPRMTGCVDMPSGDELSLEALASPSRDHPGAREIDLPPGATAYVELGDSELGFVVAVVREEAPALPLAGVVDVALVLAMLLSSFVHLGPLAALAVSAPATDAYDLRAADLRTMERLLATRDARELEESYDIVESTEPDRPGGYTLKMEAPVSRWPEYTNWELRDESRRREERRRHLRLRPGEDYELVLALHAFHPEVWTMPWSLAMSQLTEDVAVPSRLDYLRDDPKSEHRSFWGMPASDPWFRWGWDELDFRIGRGGPMQPGLPGGVHTPPRVTLRPRLVKVYGSLPLDVVSRIVRQNFGRFRLCYEKGLRGRPDLAGTVSVRFVVDTTGGVESARDGGSSLPDKDIVECIVRGFGNLSFPAPESGKVTVVFPIGFSPPSMAM